MENITQLAWIILLATSPELENNSTVVVPSTAWTMTENSTVAVSNTLAIKSSVAIPTSLSVNSTVAIPTSLAETSTIVVPIVAPVANNIIILISKLYYAVVVPLLVLVGIVLNVLSILVVHTIDRKSSTTVYLLNLAVSDICVNLCGLVACFFRSMEQFKYSIISEMTDIESLTYYFTIPSAIGNLITTAISAERFVAIVFPLKIRQLKTRKISVVTVIFIYLYVLTINIPSIIMDNLRSSEGSQSDQYDRFLDILYLWTVFGLRIIPVLAVTFLSFISVLALCYRRRYFNKESKRSTRDQREMKVTKTLLVLTFTFIFCQLPGTILRLKTVSAPGVKDISIAANSGIFTLIRFIFYLLFNVNSCVNFFIYIGTSKEYRHHFKTLIKCRSIRKGPLKPPDNISTITSNVSITN